jgi:ribosome biogenesis GTPase / thiamine phosphate phosphatase
MIRKYLEMKTNYFDHSWIDPNLGIVLKKSIGVYSVYNQGQVISCELSSGLRRANELPNPSGNGKHKRQKHEKRQPADPVAVGDLVRFHTRDGGHAQIVEILPRRNHISRRSAVPMPSAVPSEQVIAANVDQVVPVFAAANPAPKWNLLDRYLVSAEAAWVPALICITKLDLAQGEACEVDPSLQEVVSRYRRIGYPVILVSTVSGEGLDEIRQALHGKLSVLLGKSGVGKTSLLNALQPGLGLRVNQVSQVTGKGRHTTTSFEIFPLEGSDSFESGSIVDTPGVREFGLWDVNQDELAEFFPEMRPYLGSCRFGLNCRHDEEPDCEIRKAVVQGQISPYRWRSYLQLRNER